MHKKLTFLYLWNFVPATKQCYNCFTSLLWVTLWFYHSIFL